MWCGCLHNVSTLPMKTVKSSQIAANEAEKLWSYWNSRQKSRTYPSFLVLWHKYLYKYRYKYWEKYLNKYLYKYFYSYWNSRQKFGFPNGAEIKMQCFVWRKAEKKLTWQRIKFNISPARCNPVEKFRLLGCTVIIPSRDVKTLLAFKWVLRKQSR